MNLLTDERFIEDLELFAIDNESSDSTIEIAKEYARKPPSSIFLVYRENDGYGTNVNYNIKHVTGKYFKLLDEDNWFDTNGLFALVNRLEPTNCDIILTNYMLSSNADSLENIESVVWEKTRL